MIELAFDKCGGLLPAIVQDHASGEVLMMAYMNLEAWEATLASGKATFWSRSRSQLWVKGESSGNTQLVKEIRVDCDADTILLRVIQIGGAACHTGHPSCFYRRVTGDTLETTSQPVFDPKEVYKQ
ncbi:MAG: phosphoribosyl-AMP cyclohydrolase [Pseudomonadota bacterium]